ncbi:hypothetical protein EVAR_99570_1 [Eumeta japonica]|uniref:Mos1 transposase HTH domain-containing protein n=1 Tax=Eumeta variegata TaxID=151549 RepID=A0A4C1YST9_EUMVA|nr:hypothetical protein EVAR_99570_1 [Eumeta japonica]
MIYYVFRRGLTQKQCIDHLTSIIGDEAPSKTTVDHWFSEFNRGRNVGDMLKDEFKESRLKSVVPLHINAVGLNNARSSCYISQDKEVFEEIRKTTDNAESFFIMTMLAVIRRPKQLGFEGQKIKLTVIRRTALICTERFLFITKRRINYVVNVFEPRRGR